MKHVVIIRAADGFSGGWLNLGNIQTPKGVYAIVRGMGGEIRCMLRSEVLPSDDIFLTQITPQKAFSFSFDDTKKGDSRNDERALAAEVIPYHQQMLDVPGFVYYNSEGKQQSFNPNAGTGRIFDMEDIAANHAKNVKIINQLIAAMNKVKAMSYREKLDALFYYGENPITANGVMTHSEAFVRLVEPAFGVVLKRSIFSGTGLTYNEHFITQYSGVDEENALKTTIIKAMVLKDKQGDTMIKQAGTAMLFAGSVIGNSIDEAMAYFKNNEKLKQSLISLVSQIDTVNTDDMDEVLTKFENGNTDVRIKMDMKNNYNSLRERADKLRIPLPGTPTIDTLEQKIAEAEPVWEKVKLYGLEPKINQDKRVKLPKIIEWVEEHEKQLRKEIKKEKEVTA